MFSSLIVQLAQYSKSMAAINTRSIAMSWTFSDCSLLSRTLELSSLELTKKSEFEIGLT